MCVGFDVSPGSDERRNCGHEPNGERLVVAEREQRAMAPDNPLDAAARPRRSRSVEP